MYAYKLKLLTEIKIHLMFYISLLQPLKNNPITYEIPSLFSVIINNGNSSYFINLINNIQ